MTNKEYRKAIAIVGLSQLGAARFFKAGPRTGQRWAAKGPPNGIALCLNIMLALKLSASDVVKLLTLAELQLEHTKLIRSMKLDLEHR